MGKDWTVVIFRYSASAKVNMDFNDKDAGSRNLDLRIGKGDDRQKQPMTATAVDPFCTMHYQTESCELA